MYSYNVCNKLMYAWLLKRYSYTPYNSYYIAYCMNNIAIDIHML